MQLPAAVQVADWHGLISWPLQALAKLGFVLLFAQSAGLYKAWSCTAAWYSTSGNWAYCPSSSATAWRGLLTDRHCGPLRPRAPLPQSGAAVWSFVLVTYQMLTYTFVNSDYNGGAVARDHPSVTLELTTPTAVVKIAAIRVGTEE